MDRLRSGQDVAPAAPDVNDWYNDPVEPHNIPVDAPHVTRRGERKFIPQWHRVREGHDEKATGAAELPAAAAPKVVDMSAQKMKAVKPAYEKPKAKAKAKPNIKFEAIKPEL